MNSNLVRTLKLSGWVLACASGALAACSVYDTSLLVAGDGGGSGGTSANGGTAGTSSGGNSGGGTGGQSTDKFWNDMEVGDPGECPTEGRPDKSMRPTETPDGDVGPVFVGWHRMRFGAAKDLETLDLEPEAWKDIGFNLDRSCNSATWPEGVLMGSAIDTCGGAKLKACKNSLQNVFDGNYCKDNAIGTLFGIAAVSPILGEPFRLTELDYNCAMHRGSWGVIFKISQYNGELNDSSVRLDLYSSVGVTSPAAWNCRPSTQSGSENALIDNWQDQADQPLSKQWQFSERDIDMAAPPPPNGDPVKNSKWADSGAYVRNGWVIAELPAASELWFNGLNAHSPGIRLVMQNTIIAAQLVKDRQSELWSITEGTIGGSIKPNDMITSFREIGFCENACDSYATTIGYLNQYTDMLSGSNEAVPDATCDALSFGIDFTARQVTPGPTVSVPAPPDVTAGKCGTPPDNDLIDKPGCVCPVPPAMGRCITPDPDGGT